MLSGLFIKGDNGLVVLAHKTISVPLKVAHLTDYNCHFYCNICQIEEHAFVDIKVSNFKIYSGKLIVFCCLSRGF